MVTQPPFNCSSSGITTDRLRGSRDAKLLELAELCRRAFREGVEVEAGRRLETDYLVLG